MIIELLLVGVGGFLGAIIRFLFSFFLNKDEGKIPIGTFFANVFACFLFGLLSTSIILTLELQLFLVTGFLGSLSTFSTYMIEHSKIKEQDKIKAYLYLFLSIFTGIFMFLIGAIISL